jgi:hypothetical protein
MTPRKISSSHARLAAGPPAMNMTKTTSIANGTAVMSESRPPFPDVCIAISSVGGLRLAVIDEVRGARSFEQIAVEPWSLTEIIRQ